MRYKATLSCDSDGCEATSDELDVTVRAPSAASALEVLRAEIRYRIEWCPCTGVDDDFVELELG